ncbi:glucose-6-phosphate dehydrogenase [Actinopolymorpha singaporensis]|uniref:Glucose-6-phosphate 1-dehydrogenase n=1 Tax=Actinopolymorpha singaporensis TaxID=117157 RepID=A0A1H1TQV0_9ACTN|nr:glucose-6-phosphate dehydrogenase (NADP(+)) [Actinopolymorpha singaporensis]SDS62572.1 glucose-6-phosphate 1-dehydrogenase [Actinopolymorpha singaporensis]
MNDQRADSMVIFGATGDLAMLQTYPALVSLVERGVLDFPIIGVGHHERSREYLRDYARKSLQRAGIDTRGQSAARLVSLLDYVAGDLDDDTTYQAISDRLGERRGTLFYLEVPPSLFGRIAEGIASVGRQRDSRVMVEKPFGTDLASARELSATMHKVFPEDAIFRVDHWLALESLENILYTRFANSILDPLLNERYVEHIEITMAEDFGVADRGAFYEQTGAIRDVLQNHLLQLLVSVLADEPRLGVRTWRSERTRAMQELRPLRAHEVVRGQYVGYRDVDGTAPDSTVETFVAVRLTSDSPRWSGVPIDIRAGKCMPVTATELTIRFRPPARDVCGIENFGQMNELRFRVRPETAMTLTLAGKRPGIAARAQTEELTFAQQPGLDPRPYDRLIGAALDGDDFYFAREDSVDAAWKVVDPVLGDAAPVHSYQPGTWGPGEADSLLPDGVTWHDPTA